MTLTPEIIQLIETIVAVLIGGLAMKLIDYQKYKKREANRQDNHIIDQLQEEMVSLRERVAKLEEQVEVKNSRIVVLERDNATLASEKAHLENTTERLIKKLNDKDRLIASLKNQLKRGE